MKRLNSETTAFTAAKKPALATIPELTCDENSDFCFVGGSEEVLRCCRKVFPDSAIKLDTTAEKLVIYVINGTEKQLRLVYEHSFWHCKLYNAKTIGEGSFCVVKADFFTDLDYTQVILLLVNLDELPHLFVVDPKAMKLLAISQLRYHAKIRRKQKTNVVMGRGINSDKRQCQDSDFIRHKNLLDLLSPMAEKTDDIPTMATLSLFNNVFIQQQDSSVQPYAIYKGKKRGYVIARRADTDLHCFLASQRLDLGRLLMGLLEPQLILNKLGKIHTDIARRNVLLTHDLNGNLHISLTDFGAMQTIGTPVKIFASIAASGGNLLAPERFYSKQPRGHYTLQTDLWETAQVCFTQTKSQDELLVDIILDYQEVSNEYLAELQVEANELLAHELDSKSELISLRPYKTQILQMLSLRPLDRPQDLLKLYLDVTLIYIDCAATDTDLVSRFDFVFTRVAKLSLDIDFDIEAYQQRAYVLLFTKFQDSYVNHLGVLTAHDIVNQSSQLLQTLDSVRALFHINQLSLQQSELDLIELIWAKLIDKFKHSGIDQEMALLFFEALCAFIHRTTDVENNSYANRLLAYVVVTKNTNNQALKEQYHAESSVDKLPPADDACNGLILKF